MMNDNLMNLLKNVLTDEMVGQLSSRIGGDATPEKVKVASLGIFSTLIGALSNNAEKEEGASSLFNALKEDHDGSIIDNIIQFVNPSKPNPAPERTTNGGGILDHILGHRRGSIIDAVSKMSGLNWDSTGSLIKILAPIVMGMLGKQQRQRGFNIADLVGLLTLEKKKQQSNNNESPFLKLLDRNNDGSYLDDVVNVGSNLFKMFGK